MSMRIVVVAPKPYNVNQYSIAVAKSIRLVLQVDSARFFSDYFCWIKLKKQLISSPFTIKGELMNKKELIAAISGTSGLNKSDAESALNAVISSLTDLLAKGDSIVLPGFASLSVKERAARTGRNPATGQPIDIAASKVVIFKTGKKLKEAVNN